MTVTAHPLADQLADRWNKLHPYEEEEETMSVSAGNIASTNPTITGTHKRVGPRDGKSHLEWAAEDLGFTTTRPCGHCEGTGIATYPVKPADIARALTGQTAKSGSGVMLSKVTEDPPLSMLRDVAKRLEVSLDEAASWIQKLHKAELARRNGG